MVYGLPAQGGCSAFVRGDVHELVYQVAGVVGAERPFGFDVMLLQQIAHDVLIIGNFALVQHPAHDFAVLVIGRGADFDFVANAAQKRLVYQIFGGQIGRKDEQNFERHFDFAPCVHGEEVYPLFHGHNPAVEQVVRPNLLAAEVVYQEHAAVGFHLEGGFVILGVVVVAQFQPVQRQLTADHDGRAADANPTAVALRGWLGVRLGHGGVVGLVVNNDDLAIHLHRIRDVHLFA